MIWTKNSVLERLAAYKAKHSLRSNDDAALNPLNKISEKPVVWSDKSLTPAAVLVPLINRLDEITVLLTIRNKHLNNHAGQISFPGGQVDLDDRDPEHTALRETDEEIGLAAQNIEIVGRLDDYIVGTGFLVHPIIGFIEPPLELTPHENEVADVFEAPLSFVTHPDNFERHTREIKGAKRSFFAVQWNDHFIWGATAGMLRDLSQRLWNGVR